MSLLTVPALEVSPGSSVWVEPIRPLKPRVMRRSAMENICARVHPTFTLFFKLRDGDDPLVHFEHLRQGLSRLIYRDEVLAGTLDEDDRGHFSVRISEAPDAGVRFHYSDLSQDYTFPDFQYLEKANFPFADGELDGLERLRPNPFPAHVHGDPVLVPQLTHVRGGLVIFLGMSHMVTDMVRGIDFLTQWGIFTRTIAEAAAQQLPSPPIPAQLPDHLTDVSPLLPPSRGPASLKELQECSKTFPNFKLIDPNDPAGSISELQNFVPPPHIGQCNSDEEDHAREAVLGAWHFSKAVLNDLHSKALHASPGVKMSAMDVFVAFLWGRYFIAKYPVNPHAPSPTQGLYGEIPSESAIIFAVNIRGKMTPPLHPSYMGAAVDVARVKASAALLTSPHDKRMQGITQVAAAIRVSNSTWNEEHFMTMLELTQQTPTCPGFIPIGPMDFLITDHRGFASFSQADWGPGLGQSVTTREPYVGRPFPSGEIVIIPGHNMGDIEVTISSERVVLERLSRDPEIGKRAEHLFTTCNVVEAYQRDITKSSKL